MEKIPMLSAAVTVFGLVLSVVVTSSPVAAFALPSSSSAFLDNRGRTVPPTTTALSAATAASPDPPWKSKRAIVVGGGPAGLAAALLLSKAPHSMDVTVLESNPASVSDYDPAKAFLYLIDGRGQTFTERFPNIQSKLVERSVSMKEFFLTVIPADPQEKLPEPRSLPIALKDRKSSYWIPRNEFVKILLEEVEEEEEKRRTTNEGVGSGSITMIKGAKCLDVSLPATTSDDECGVVKVSLTMTKEGETSPSSQQILEGDLVVGADGLKSRVRESLSRLDGNRRKRFQMKLKNSPAAGLRYKVLQLPPKFPVPLGDGTFEASTGQMAYALGSVNTGPTDTLRLGVLPMRDDTKPRTANCITKPDHVIWTITDGEKMREWFAESCPRMPFQREADGGMISDAEWERFAKAEGGRFPTPQWCDEMCELSADGKSGGVALVGDAVHSFPPDIGQGVNSALGDVLELDSALMDEAQRGGGGGDSSPSSSLGGALASYEKKRRPQVSSLIRLCASSNPLQYSQPGFVLSIRKKLWLANFLLRTVLNKLSFGLVPNHTFLLVQDYKLSYRQITRRADVVTVSLTSALLFGVYAMIRRVAALLGKSYFSTLLR